MERGFEGKSPGSEKEPVRDAVEEEVLAAERAQARELKELELKSDEGELHNDFEKGMAQETKSKREKFGSGFKVFSRYDGKSAELKEKDGEDSSEDLAA